ncbi:hypothetical protein SCLCIDRAFT_24358 [Scleroderma citrinum Foug A]|uniref:Uncharacterized protein n=1 Tax=Scleroderma citrinum Foug A TaxID=1036808 RepID=A0A0C3E436_9AGAM|nr:hypothetical protein SCLCIDRAFT_24358 [Scleroderma citrinum Foug A]
MRLEPLILLKLHHGLQTQLETTQLHTKLDPTLTDDEEEDQGPPKPASDGQGSTPGCQCANPHPDPSNPLPADPGVRVIPTARRVLTPSG